MLLAVAGREGVKKHPQGGVGICCKVARCRRTQSLRLGDGDNGKSLDFVGVFAKKSGFNDNV